MAVDKNEPVDIKIVGAAEQSWSDFQRGNQQRKEKWDWKLSGSLGEVDIEEEITPLQAAYFRWCETNSPEGGPPVKLVIEPSFQQKRPSVSEAFQAEKFQIHVGLEPTVPGMTRAELERIRSEIKPK